MRNSRTYGRFTTAIAATNPDEASSLVLLEETYENAFALSANAPLTLDDPEALWVVVSGEVDLFHVRSSSDAFRVNRRYVGTLRAGEVVAGATPNPAGGDGVLIAVGFGGARLQALRRRAVDEVPHEGARVARALTNGVVECIGRAMHRASRASARPLDVTSGKVTLEAGATITTAADVTWVRLNSGELLLGGDVAIAPTPLLIPMARGMWFKAGSEGATLFVLDSFTAFAGKRISAALEQLWGVFLAWLTKQAEADDETEQRRLARKIHGERAKHASALASLAGLLQGRGDAVAAEPHGDPLLEACAAIGRVAGISFRSPPPQGEQTVAKDPADPHRDDVMGICRASRVRFRRVLLRDQWWTLDAGPILAFRGPALGPVALLSSPEGRYTLLDPVSGDRIPVTPAVAATLSPLAYTFSVPAPSGAIEWRAIGRLLGRDVWPDLRRVLGFVAAGAVMGIAMPVVLGIMFNQVIPSAAMSNAWTLYAVLLSVAVAAGSIGLARALALIRVEGRANALLQSAIVDRLLSLPPQFFRKYAVGDLALRAEAVNAARQALTGVALTSLFGGAVVVTSIGLMWWYSGALALVALAVLLVSAVVTAAAGLYALPYERRRQALFGTLGTLVFEMLSGIAKLHVAAAERRMFALWGAQFRELKVVSFKAGIAAAALAVFNAMLPIVAAGAVFLMAARVFAIPGSLSTGSFIAFNAAFATALAAGIGVSTTLVSVLNVIPLFERAMPILQALPEVDEAKPDVGVISGRIEIAKLSFGYIAGAPPIIDDVSFQIRPGEFVAFVGPSGSGKSTILRLLLGFERPDRGAVYYDGHDLASIDVGSIRRQAAVVLQHSKLLAGDIFTNIVGAAPLSHEDAWRAADLAGLSDDINAMPMGMHTVISEGGSTLSGGQRQRLLIARALVRNPRVVCFDEATSALDNRTQDIVTRSLERMQATRIVIAHRLTTVQRADRIFVLSKGVIVQQGRYDDLVNADGLFKDLAQRQLV